MVHKPNHSDSEPIGRYEDALLDPDADLASQESARRHAAQDPDYRRRLIDRQFAHGLLISESELGRPTNELRLRSAMSRVRSEATRPWWSRPGWAAAAAILLLAVGGGVVALINNDPPTQPIVQGPPPAKPEPVLEYQVVSGNVAQYASVGGTWRLAADESSQAVLRIGDGLATLSPGAEVMVDASGRNFELRRGKLALEGKGIRLPVGSQFATLYGGPVVLSDGVTGGLIELYSGKLKGEDGQELLQGGHQKSGTAEPVSLSVILLPIWVAQGRTEDLFQELNTLTGGRLTEQRDAWIETLRPILAEPLTREMVLRMVHRSLDGTLEDQDIMLLLEFTGTVLSEFRRMAEERGLTYEDEVSSAVTELVQHMSNIPESSREMFRQQQRAMLEHWRSLSEEEKAAQRKIMSRMIENMRKRRERSNLPESPGNGG